MVASIMTRGMQTRISRRALLAAVSALPLAGAAWAQPAGIRLLRLNSFGIRVAEPAVSLDFYQGLFGMPVQARDANRVCLRVGEGPQFMSIRAVGAGESPAITHIGYAVDDFAVAPMQDALVRIGFARVAAPPESEGGSAHRMQTWTRQRGESQELYFADDRGLIVQLSHADYCGGTGANGASCAMPEAAPQGRIRLADLNHFTSRPIRGRNLR
jgi:catechol 2,3-dioxygenase-like lactoylglutathione lyase family enzyme